MKNKFLFTVILTSLCLLIFIVKTFAQEYKTESFKVSKGGKLRIESSGGDIHVKVWENNEVKIMYEYDDEYSNTKIEQSGNNITVRSDDYVDFDVTVPSQFDMNLNTSGGDIEVSNNIRGSVRVNTSGGDIGVKNVDGELVLNTAGGDVKCGNVKGNAKLSSSGGDVVVGMVDGECKVSTGGGNVKVDDVTKTLVIATGGGNVKTGKIGSDVNIVTGGGNVSLDNAGGKITVTTGGGNIFSAGVNNGGEITTGAGNVSLKNLSDGVEITSGAGNVSAEFVSVGNKESKLVSGYGNITIYIPENSKATIEAIVKFGEGTWTIDKKEISEVIKSDFVSSTEDQRKGEYRAVYVVNGGGTNIYLQTSVGSIEIKKLKR